MAELARSRRFVQTVKPAVRYQPLVNVAIAAIAGVIFDRAVPLPLALWWLFAAGLLSVWLVTANRGRTALASLILGGSCAALAAGWHHVRWNLFAADQLATFAPTDSGPVCLRARVIGNVSWLPVRPFDPLRGMPDGPRSRLRLAVLEVRDGACWQPASGNATLDVEGRASGFEPGMRLEILAQMARIGPPLNPGEFDYAAHARADRQLVRLWADSTAALTILDRPGGFAPSLWLNRLRAVAGRQLQEQLAADRVGLADALLLGTRDQLDEVRTQDYFLTGMVHVLSISGLHVGILAAGLFWLLRLGLLPRTHALAAVAMVTLGYAVFIGAEAPAVRATIIVLAACISLAAGRRALEFNTLAAAGLVVLAMNPADLFRSGPQLSFLAAGTLAWMLHFRRDHREAPDPLDRLIADSRPWPLRMLHQGSLRIGEALLVTAAVWAATLPLVASNFHLVSPVALLLTPILALPFAISLFAGLLLVFWGWLLPPLAAAAGWLCDRSLALADGLVHAATGWSGSHIWITGPAGWWVAGLYAFILLWMLARQRLPKARGAALLLAGWAVVGGLPPWFASRPRGELACTFLSVGHGSATVIETPDGKTFLYDAGRLGSPHGAAQTISGYLWSRRIMRLDGVVVSHADVDHFNGLPELFDRFRIDTLHLSRQVLDHPSSTANLLISAATSAGTRIEALAAGDRLPMGRQVRATVVLPEAGAGFQTDNANSIVLMLEHNGRRILLPGDLEGDGLARLLEQKPTNIDVLLAPHHGSPRSRPAELARWAHPRWVVISGSAKDDKPQSREAYAATGARVLATCRSGAITVASGHVLSVDCFRPTAELLGH